MARAETQDDHDKDHVLVEHDEELHTWVTHENIREQEVVGGCGRRWWERAGRIHHGFCRTGFVGSWERRGPAKALGTIQRKIPRDQLSAESLLEHGRAEGADTEQARFNATLLCRSKIIYS